MKVVKVYDKDSNIRIYDRNVFKATEAVLAKFPEEYSYCYKINLETLELLQVDKFLDETMAGEYNTNANVIYFNNRNAIGHELFHMASNDIDGEQYAFYSGMEIESALIEGMTEYFTVKAYDLEKPGAYPFEVFCVTMLDDIPNIFRPYFVPSYEDFIGLFPNKRDIYSLLYSLDVYNNLYLDFLADDYAGKDPTIDFKLLKESINDTFNALINIKLSMEQDPTMLKKFDYKFMEYIGSDKLGLLFKELYPRYYEYADKLVDKKIRKRIK